jgi:hypothetical protein
MRRLLTVWLACAVGMMLGAAAAGAQPIALSDGTYGSPSEYLAGTWKWDRPEPRQTMMMTFERNGGFYYKNLTTGLEHWGSYSVKGDEFHVVVKRSCSEQGTNCADRDPPLTVENNFKPTSANVFMSNDERWNRQK